MGRFPVLYLGSLAKGDSPQCGEMSRSDRGDGHRLGGGFAIGERGGIVRNSLIFYHAAAATGVYRSRRKAQRTAAPWQR